MTPWEVFGMVAATIGLILAVITVGLILGRMFPDPVEFCHCPECEATQ